MGAIPSPRNVDDLTRAVRQLQAQVAGTTGPAPGTSFSGVLLDAPNNSDTFNGVTSMLYLEPSASTAKSGGITVKRTESTWGVSAGTPQYGDAQPFEVLSPSATLADDLTTDGQSTSGAATGTNPVLVRIDAFGGIGTVQGVHIAPGLRKTYGGGTPIGLWVELSGVDTYGVAITGPNPAYVPSPFSPLLSIASYANTKYVQVDSNGDLYSYNVSSGHKTAGILHGGATPGFVTTYADDGTTGVAALYAGNSPAIGYRGILAAQTASTRVLGLKAAAAQSGVLLGNLASDGVTLLSCVDSKGDFITFADDGTTGLGAVYAGTTPAVGFRAIFAAGTAATTVLGLKQATSQSGDLLATYNSSGSKIATIIDSTGHLTATAGVSAWNGRTGSVSMTASDVTGTSGLVATNGGIPGLDSSGRITIATGVSAPVNPSTIVGWVGFNVAGNVIKCPAYQ